MKKPFFILDNNIVTACKLPHVVLYIEKFDIIELFAVNARILLISIIFENKAVMKMNYKPVLFYLRLIRKFIFDIVQ